LPDWFKSKAPELLAKVVAIAEDPSHEHQYRALEWCVERHYGKARAEVEVSGQILTPAAEAIAALAAARLADEEKKP
jgi:hypothetical protein